MTFGDNIYAPLPTVSAFTGDYAWLSNFHEGYPIWFMNRLWPTREHLYQALKCANSAKREELLDKMQACASPGASKAYGRKIPLRPDWEMGVKVTAMMLVVGLSLVQHSYYHEQLASTCGIVLIESNYWHDNFFGMCVCNACKARKVVGLNMLGTIWMGFRDGTVALEKIRMLAYLMEIEYGASRQLSFSNERSDLYDITAGLATDQCPKHLRLTN